MKRLDLTDRCILVTGASSGLGRAVAFALAVNEGARVVAVARREPQLQQLCAEIVQAGGAPAQVLPADLLEEGAAEQVVERASALAGGELFGLVNNAGVTWYGRFEQMPVEQIERIIRLNLSVSIRLTSAFVRQVGAVTHHGDGNKADQAGSTPQAAILTITSLGAFVPVPYQSVYAASKHALQAFSESIAAELRSRKIVVTAVAPGGIQTEMIELAGLHHKFSGSSLASADRVAHAAINAWKRGRLRTVPGIGNKLAAIAARLLPSRLIAAASERLFRP
jgi:uncharacterized protein